MTVAALWQPFGLPPGGPAEAFAAAQVALYRHDPARLPYLFALQRHVSFTAAPELDRPSRRTADRTGHRTASPRQLLLSAARAADRLAAGAGPRRRQVDVLLCGVWAWERPTETRLWLDVVETLLLHGRTLAVLAHGGSVLARRLRRQRRDQLAAGQLHLVDPRGLAGRAADRLGEPGVLRAAARSFRQVREVLAAQGIRLDAEALRDFAWITARGEEWLRWSGRLDFRAALVRCHWLPLGSDVARTGLERGVPTSTFQQGVVGHSLDAPLAAHRMAVFGAPSAGLLDRLDRTFSAATGRRSTCRELLPAGSFLDRPHRLPPPAHPGTVVVLDQAQPWALRYYGLGEAQAGLERGLDELLRRRPSARVVLRLHPATEEAAREGPGPWERLRTRHPDRVGTSPPDRPLERDLEMSTAAVTLFSGAGATAAAAGRPVFFHRAPGGFSTPDLAPFAPLETTDPEELADRLAAVLEGAGAHARERELAGSAARAYFGGGEAPPLDRLVGALTAPL